MKFQTVLNTVIIVLLLLDIGKFESALGPLPGKQDSRKIDEFTHKFLIK